MEKSGPVLANALRKGKEGSKDVIQNEVKDYALPDSDIEEVILDDDDDDDDNSESNDAMLQRRADYQTKELNRILNVNSNDSRVNGNKYKEVYFEGTFEDYINAEIQAEILRSKKKGSFTHPIFNDKLISVDLNHPSPENENNAADSENGYGISEDISVYDLGLYLRDSEKEHMEYMDKSYPRYFQCAENLIDGKCSVMPYFMKLASGDSSKTRVGFKCFICSKFFFTRNGIMKHLVQHLNTICYFCNKVTKASQKLKRHIMQQHYMQLVNDNIRCKYCEEKFIDFDLYMDHIKAHFNYHCAMCPFESENPNDLVSHINQEHMNYKANCIDCSLFYDDENLKEHLTEVARIGFVCMFCGMAFHNDVFLKIHYEIYGPSHGNGIVNDDEFNSFSHILDITASEVLKGTPTASSSTIPVKADKKKSTTTKKIDIKRVKKIVTEKIQTIIPQPQASSSQSQYSCEYCLKSFGRKENLIRHVRSHTGETPYQCQLCNKAFARSDQLNVHMRGHKGHNIVFKCVICSKQFASRPSLNGHLRIHRNVSS